MTNEEHPVEGTTLASDGVTTQPLSFAFNVVYNAAVGKDGSLQSTHQKYLTPTAATLDALNGQVVDVASGGVG